MTSNEMPFPKVAMIGFGEAGRAFVSGWTSVVPLTVLAYDIKLDDARTAAGMREAMTSLGVVACESAQAALAEADIVFCLVTADRAAEAASSYADGLKPGTLWLDGNSCAPGTKRQAAQAVEAAGGRYVDMAIMAPVHPKLHRTPVLLAGPAALEVEGILRRMDMTATTAGDNVGDASTIKMLRSVMIKGLEALVAECVLSAREAGVEDAVLASLNASDPGIDWIARSSYNLERMMVHGKRRAAEMREVAATVRALGLPDRMSSAIAEWQDEIAALELAGGEDRLTDRSDRILGALGLGAQKPAG